MDNKFLKILLLVFVLWIVNPSSSYALFLTHPEERNMVVSEDGIFFSGKINKYEKVFIDGVRMTPERNGAFSYSVKLKEGENIFAVQKKDLFLNTETIKYEITRVSPREEKTHNQFIKQESSYYEIMEDNTVLRSTPINKGMNRLGYLPAGTKVFVDGITNEFSRIYLAQNQYGWIMTKYLRKCTDEENQDFHSDNGKDSGYTPKVLLNTGQIKTENEKTYTYTLSDNTPYSAVSDGDKLYLSIYNLDTSDEVYTKEFQLKKFPRYSVCMQNGILYLTFMKCPVNNSDYSNRDVKIVIDAGHGGSETGAVGCLGDKEKVLNLDVALRLKKILEQHNFNVSLTRECDKFVSLKDRVKYAQDKDALIFVSIHLNSVLLSDNPNLNSGSVVFYFNPQAQKFAQILSKSISGGLKTQDGGSQQASFAVIRPTEYIGVLAELAYLVNPKDVKIYRSKHFAQTSAEAIYKGIVNYIHSEL